MKAKIITLFLLALFLVACNEQNLDQYIDKEYDILSSELNLPQEVYDYTTELPAAFGDISGEIEKNPEVDRLNNHMATLGRVLFYDPILSKNQEVSCASCHLQERAFADNLVVSEGFEGNVGIRNSLALATTLGFETSYGGSSFSIPQEINSVNRANFSWDDSVFDIIEQSRLAITSEIEMGMTMDEVVSRLSKDPKYGILFNNAFESPKIHDFNVLMALSRFVNSISSINSKFDQALAKSNNILDTNVDFELFTEQENLGKTLFNRDCASCHGDIHSFTVVPIANNGLEMSYSDRGKGAKTGLAEDMDVFKVPFLRNIELTAPYMHDGRFATLEDVVEHYSTGISNHPNLDQRLKNRNGTVKNFDYNTEEKAALVAYLHTLTDYDILTDVRFSDPFK